MASSAGVKMGLGLTGKLGCAWFGAWVPGGDDVLAGGGGGVLNDVIAHHLGTTQHINTTFVNFLTESQRF